MPYLEKKKLIGFLKYAQSIAYSQHKIKQRKLVRFLVFPTLIPSCLEMLLSSIIHSSELLQILSCMESQREEKEPKVLLPWAYHWLSHRAGRSLWGPCWKFFLHICHSHCLEHASPHLQMGGPLLPFRSLLQCHHSREAFPGHSI